uniref:Uncharacterized protein n=1 Tax=Anopheles minimus TaxID=112268 RepID=A0A182WNU3_9DIPT
MIFPCLREIFVLFCFVAYCIRTHTLACIPIHQIKEYISNNMYTHIEIVIIYDNLLQICIVLLITYPYQ